MGESITDFWYSQLKIPGHVQCCVKPAIPKSQLFQTTRKLPTFPTPSTSFRERPHRFHNNGLMENRYFLGKEGELVCRTCHKPHYAEDREFLLVEHRGNDSLCVQCHQEQSRITGSSHDLRKSVPEEKNVLNKQAREIGPCASCHLVHQGVGTFMWARSIQENDSNPARFCENCHAQGQCAEQALPGDFSHPMDQIASDDSSPITLPLFDKTGKRNQSGKMSCSTCHDAHNPHPVHTDRTAGETHR